jgi:hypothetical protein
MGICCCLPDPQTNSYQAEGFSSSRRPHPNQTNARNLRNFSRRRTRASLDMYMCNQ